MIVNKIIENISILKNRCRSSECSVIGVLFRMMIFQSVHKKKILTAPNVKIRNSKNIILQNKSN